MGLDIRLPIGLMFTVLGPLLIITGIVDGTSLNTQCGSAMGVFGLVMLGLGIAAQRRSRADAAQARETENLTAGVKRPYP